MNIIKRFINNIMEIKHTLEGYGPEPISNYISNRVSNKPKDKSTNGVAGVEFNPSSADLDGRGFSNHNDVHVVSKYIADLVSFPVKIIFNAPRSAGIVSTINDVNGLNASILSFSNVLHGIPLNISVSPQKKHIIITPALVNNDMYKYVQIQ